MSDENPREFRRDLGEGWCLVVSTAHRDALIYLEGPYGIRATVPQENAQVAFRVLGIPITFRGKPGRPPKITRRRLALAILQVYEAGSPSPQTRRAILEGPKVKLDGPLPTQARIAKWLDVEARQVVRAAPKEPWREFVRREVAGWEYIRAYTEAVRVGPQEPPTT